MSANNYVQCVEILKEEMSTDYLNFLFNVMEYDDSPDLTEVNPRDRKNISLYCGLLYQKGHSDYNIELLAKFKKTLNLCHQLPGIEKIEIIAVGPCSVVPLHLDDMSRPAYDTSNDWYSVLIGVCVPSNNIELLGIEIGNKKYSIEQNVPIIFDTQVPHHAWNNTKDWWVSLRLSTLKKFINV
ncbi:hypothetical protein EBU71_21305 [bacterium]|nr:hypothetical protein [Candidatus Elulimicrobium humile]